MLAILGYAGILAALGGSIGLVVQGYRAQQQPLQARSLLRLPCAGPALGGSFFVRRSRDRTAHARFLDCIRSRQQHHVDSDDLHTRFRLGGP